MYKETSDWKPVYLMGVKSNMFKSLFCVWLIAFHAFTSALQVVWNNYFKLSYTSILFLFIKSADKIVLWLEIIRKRKWQKKALDVKNNFKSKNLAWPRPLWLLLFRTFFVVFKRVFLPTVSDDNFKTNSEEKSVDWFIYVVVSR